MAYPDSVDSFTDKLNKLDGNTYTIEETVPVVGGIYEGLLQHDNVSLTSINVYTGSKLTGDKITNYIVSTPSLTPWKKSIKIFSSVSPIYITYETQGDTVEAEDINQVQDSIVNTQKEIDRYKSINDTRLTNVENNKAEKTYVDTQLNLKADKENTYTKTETDARIQNVVGAAPAALDTLKEIDDALGDDKDFAGTMTKNLALKVDKVEGKQLSTEDYTTAEKNKLAGIQDNANNYLHPATHPGNMITEDSTHRWTTDAEKANWNTVSDKSNIEHTHVKADITDLTTTLPGNVVLNSVVTSGFYRVGWAPVNAPSGSNIDYGQLIVSRGVDTVFQIITGYENGEYYMRQAGIGGNPTWQPWRKLWHDGNLNPTSFAPSGYGLGTSALNITGNDLNLIDKTGFYRGYNLTNAPVTGWVWIINMTHSDSLWMSQTAVSYGTGNTPNIMYIRVLQNGTWTAWKQIASIIDIPTSLPASGGNSDTVGGVSILNIAKSNTLGHTTAANLNVNTSLATGIYSNYGDGILNADGSVFKSGWWHIIHCHHADGNGFDAQIAVPLSPSGGVDNIYYRHAEAGTWGGWKLLWDSSNLTKVSQLTNDSNYVTATELGNAGYGDMTKAVYDKDADGIVDNAKAVGGKQLQDIESDISTAVNNVQIGGKNYLLNSSLINNLTNWNGSNGSAIAKVTTPPESSSFPAGVTSCIGNTNTAGNGYTFQTLTLLPNKNYTVSFWVYIPSSVTGTPCISVWYVKDGGWNTISNITITEKGKWVRKSFIFTTDANYPSTIIGVGLTAASVGDISYCALGKLEQGNKATDWTPAPEDMIHKGCTWNDLKGV